MSEEQPLEPAATGAVTLEGPVGIVGLGLVGGSLARAIKLLPGSPSVLASSQDTTDLAGARQGGVVDGTFLDPLPVIEGSRIVVLALPLRPLIALVREHADLLGRKELVMDVASLKAPVLRAVQAAGLERRFVGAHPMAGGEGSGYGESRADLVRGCRIWLVEDGVDGGAKERAVEFWTALGGEPRWTEADRHDRDMAWCSHLPQLVSNALAGALDAAGYRVADLGPGGRDMVRLSGSSPEMWRELLDRSAPAVGLGLESVSRALQVLADLLARRDMDEIQGFMERTRRWRGEGPWT